MPHKRFHFPSLVAVQNLLALHHTIWRGISKIGVPVVPPLLGRGVVSPRLLNLVVFAHTVRLYRMSRGPKNCGRWDPALGLKVR